MTWLKNLLLGSDGPKRAAASGPTKVDAYETTSTGLQYADLRAGSGASPQKGQKVTVHYSGWLTSGKPFDSSLKRNKPFTFELGRRKVIRGWEEGVATMKVGGLRQLKVPPALGYGAVGSPPVIPKNATLVFEVELLEIS
jgi:FKBP-type peptidyl-prolyl cis-trans isomerase